MSASDELKTLYEAATPGKWEVRAGGGGIESGAPDYADVVGLERRGSPWMEYEVLVLSEADARFIVAMQHAAPALIEAFAAVERLGASRNAAERFMAETAIDALADRLRAKAGGGK